MRSESLAVWCLLLLLIAIPALRHAIAFESMGSSQISLAQAPRTTPSIARTAAIAAVGFTIPTPIVGAVVTCPAERASTASLPAAPLAPLRL
jgi:hypothetical protein